MNYIFAIVNQFTFSNISQLFIQIRNDKYLHQNYHNHTPIVYRYYAFVIIIIIIINIYWIYYRV